MPQLIKLSLIALYVAAGLSLLVEGLSPYQSILLNLTGILLFIHVIEYVIVAKKLESKGHKGIVPFVQTLLFGLLYWKPLLR